MQTRFGLTVLDPPIPKTVRFAEAPGPRCFDSRARAELAGREGLPRDRRPRCTRDCRRGAADERLPTRCRPASRTAHANPLGKAALFSDVRRPGTLVVECSACGESTRRLLRRLRARQPAVPRVAPAAAEPAVQPADDVSRRAPNGRGCAPTGPVAAALARPNLGIAAGPAQRRQRGARGGLVRGRRRARPRARRRARAARADGATSIAACTR